MGKKDWETFHVVGRSEDAVVTLVVVTPWD